jgi:hypothetical protein
MTFISHQSSVIGSPSAYPTPSESSPGTNISGQDHINVEVDLHTSATQKTKDDNVEWDITSMQLLQHYSTSTCYTLSDNPAMQSFFRIVVPEIGFSHHFVLHGILAISAFHLARFNPSRKQFFITEALRHHNIALQTATPLIKDISSEDCDALYMFASNCCAFTLAQGPKPGDFMLFSDHGIAEWLSLFRGIRPMIELHLDTLRTGPLAPMIELGTAIAMKQYTSISTLPPLTALKELIQHSSYDDETVRILLDAFAIMVPIFPTMDSTGSRSSTVTIHHLGVWLYRVSGEYVELLQQKQPAALAIMAHFCVLLHQCTTSWLSEGWVEHVMQGVYNSLPRTHRLWIQWPIEQIGWVPDPRLHSIDPSQTSV